MMNSNYPLVLDLHTAVSQASIPVPRGDTARSLSITLCEDGKAFELPIGVYAVFTGEKADGTTLVNHCIIERGVIKYYFTKQTTSAIGRIAAQIKVYDADGGLITSPRITIIVHETAVTEGIDSKNESTVLEDIITTEAKRVEAEALREEAEALREQAEASRVKAEDEREDAFAKAKFSFEEERAEIVADMVDAKTDIIESATNAVNNKTAESLGEIKNATDSYVSSAKTEIFESKEKEVKDAKQEIQSEKVIAISDLTESKNAAVGDIQELRAYVDEKEKLLWSNDDIDSAFPETTLLPLPDYKKYKSFRFVFVTGSRWSHGFSKKETILPSLILELGQYGEVIGKSGGGYEPCRQVHIDENGVVSFTDNLSSSDDTEIIPIRIYGILNNEMSIDYVEDIREEASNAVKTANEAKEIALSVKPTDNILMKKFSNALVGEASNAVVKLYDISPIEHELDVKVSGVDKPSSVKLYRYGKNLLIEPTSKDKISYENGVYTQSELDTANRVLFMFQQLDGYSQLALSQANNLKAGNRYAITLDVVDAPKDTMNFRIGVSGVILNNTAYYKMWLPAGTYTLSFDLFNDTQGSISWGNMVLEAGATATEYDPHYVEPTEYTPNEDGVVEGVMSVYPTTTLICDTDGVIIDASYNKDSNKVVTSLEEGIASSANSLVGSDVGEAVILDDISPTEHELGVSVEQINLVPYPYATTESVMKGVTITRNGRSVSFSGTANVGFAFSFGAVSLEVGRYTIGGFSLYSSGKNDIRVRIKKEGVSGYVLDEDVTNISSHEVSFDITEAISEARVSVQFTNNTGDSDTISGSMTPYLVKGELIEDISKVKLFRYGKNICDIINYDCVNPNSQWHLGSPSSSNNYGTKLSTTEASDSVTVTQENDADIGAGYLSYRNGFFYIVLKERIPKDSIVSLSFDLELTKISTKEEYKNMMKICPNDNSVPPWAASINFSPVTTKQRIKTTLPWYDENAYKNNCFAIYVNGNSGIFSNFQIEYADAPTKYEPVNVTEHTPNKDGSVDGVMSVYPTTILATNTDGVTISATYNKDANKVVASLEQRIAALEAAIISQ